MFSSLRCNKIGLIKALFTCVPYGLYSSVAYLDEKVSSWLLTPLSILDDDVSGIMYCPQVIPFLLQMERFVNLRFCLLSYGTLGIHIDTLQFQMINPILK